MSFLRTSLILLLGTLPGAYLAAQVVGYVDSIEVHRTDTIYFAFGSDVLDTTALRKVRRLATDRPVALELYLEGHTDAVGSEGANDALARRRSQSTLRAAVAAGWPEDSIRIYHFGERRPEIPTAAKERRNRRVLLRSGQPRRYARLAGRVTDEQGVPLPATAIVDGQFLRDTVPTDSAGNFVLLVPLERPVQIHLYAPGHFYASHKMRLREDAPPGSFVTRLAPTLPGATMAVPDLYFIGDQARLVKSSFPTLPKLLEFVRANPDLRLEIGGHVNRPGPPEGKDTWQYELALQRAKYVYDYLTFFAVDSTRLEYKSYSNHQMIHPRPRGEFEARFNRRVEIKVLGVME